MIKHKLGARSLRKLNTCHVDLVAVIKLASARSSVDFGVSQGARTEEQQLEYFLQGKSKLDPRVPASLARAMHVTTDERPLAMAVDIYGYHADYEVRKKMAYDLPTLSYIAGVIDNCAKELYEMGGIDHLVRWGGNWDKDGVILHDQSFDDAPHYELYKP